MKKGSLLQMLGLPCVRAIVARGRSQQCVTSASLESMRASNAHTYLMIYAGYRLTCFIKVVNPRVRHQPSLLYTKSPPPSKAAYSPSILTFACTRAPTPFSTSLTLQTSPPRLPSSALPTHAPSKLLHAAPPLASF